MKTISSATWSAARALACMGLILLLLFALATLLDGILRYYLNRPIDAVRDLGPLLVAVSVAACVPLALIEKSNIRIHLFHSVIRGRAARWLEHAVDSLTLVVVAAIARQILLYANEARASGDSTMMIEWPTAPFWYAVALCFAFAALCQIAMLAVGIADRSGRHSPRPAGH